MEKGRKLIRMSDDSDIGVKTLEEMFSVRRTDGQSLSDFFEYADVDLDALFGFAFEQTVDTPLLVVVRWAAKVEFGTEPPVEDEDWMYCERSVRTGGGHVLDSLAESMISDRAWK